MSQIYAEKWSEVIETGHTKHVLTDRVKTGLILHVKNCFAYSAEVTVNEKVFIGVRNGGIDVYVRVRATESKNTGLSALNDFLVGEGDQVFAYFPSANNADTIELNIIGELFRLEEWRARQKG